MSAEAPWEHYPHDWRLTEGGYIRSWETTMDAEETVMKAVYSGSEDFSDDGDGHLYLECRTCAAVRELPDGLVIEWD